MVNALPTMADSRALRLGAGMTFLGLAALVQLPQLRGLP